MTKSEVKSIIEATAVKAASEAISALNGKSLTITGCDIECILQYEENDRNEAKGLSLKDWCKKKNYNHIMIYDCLEAKGYIVRPNKSKINPTSMELTLDGFIAFNGIIVGETTKLKSPLLTVISNSLYLDDTHTLIDEFENMIINCDGFDKGRIYNDIIKGRALVFSRREEDMMDELGIVIDKVAEIELQENDS